MSKIKSLLDEYRFVGFRPKRALKGIFGDSHARVIELVRRQKKLNAHAVEKAIEVSMTESIV